MTIDRHDNHDDDGGHGIAQGGTPPNMGTAQDDPTADPDYIAPQGSDTRHQDGDDSDPPAAPDRCQTCGQQLPGWAPGTTIDGADGWHGLRLTVDSTRTTATASASISAAWASDTARMIHDHMAEPQGSDVLPLTITPLPNVNGRERWAYDETAVAVFHGRRLVLVWSQVAASTPAGRGDYYRNGTWARGSHLTDDQVRALADAADAYINAQGSILGHH